MMMNLIKNEEVAYWVIVYISDKNDIVKIANQSIKILKTAELK